MKTLKMMLAAALSFAAFNVSAQTADEVVAKNIAAMGGAEKLSSLKSVKFEGSLSTQGLDIPITLTKVHMKGMRLDLEIMGTANYQLANETKGWVFMPVQQMDSPQEMPEDQLKSIKSQMDIQGSLFNYKEKGYTVEYVSTDKLTAGDAYKLKVVKNGETSFYFIDTKTNLLVKTTASREINGQNMEMETVYTDYKKNADGYMFAYTNNTSQGNIVFDKISSNIAVDEKIFTN
ncbi:MAG: hypothetical protein EOO13_00370 [Chitinophagaceae bacterium]|nr:MAG: hypothetical protein EOO13_00370 [Chitinophagaceae bacterium]